MTYKTKEFNIPEIKGISKKQIEEHLKLYNGYVTHTNKILDQLKEWKENNGDPYLISELRRRFGFEFDGMRSHEFYFGALEGGPKDFPKSGPLANAFIKEFSNLENAHQEFLSVAMTRGSGWAIIYWDNDYTRVQYAWIDEHHLGHLSSLDIILACDCWEHAFMVDYLPGERKTYINSYLEALNWETIESNLVRAQGK
jgi:superoxide dismutase, Fe-Mn family